MSPDNILYILLNLLPFIKTVSVIGRTDTGEVADSINGVSWETVLTASNNDTIIVNMYTKCKLYCQSLRLKFKPLFHSYFH